MTNPTLMSEKTLAKLCSWLALLYIVLCIYVMNVGRGWGFFFEPPMKMREMTGHAVGLFATPVCALIFITLAHLMKLWNERYPQAGIWNRLPVPLYKEIPSTDPVGKKYRVAFFLLVFGVGLYTQVYLMKVFLSGAVYRDNPTATSATSAPREGATAKVGDSLGQLRPAARSENEKECGGCFIQGGLEHFTKGIDWPVGNNYHFDKRDGQTYFLGVTPYGNAVLCLWMALAWGRCVGEWFQAMLRALCIRLRRPFVRRQSNPSVSPRAPTSQSSVGDKAV